MDNNDFTEISLENFQVQMYTKTELGGERMQRERKKLKESEHTNFLFNLIQNNNINLIMK